MKRLPETKDGEPRFQYNSCTSKEVSRDWSRSVDSSCCHVRLFGGKRCARIRNRRVPKCFPLTKAGRCSSGGAAKWEVTHRGEGDAVSGGI